jgi:hypothetical protein
MLHSVDIFITSMAMNFEALGDHEAQRETPQCEKLAKQLILMRKTQDSRTESVLQALITNLYDEVTAALPNRPNVGQVFNRVRGQILSELNNTHDVSPYYLSNYARRAIKEACRNKPS